MSSRNRMDGKAWSRKPVTEWTERDELDFCRHLMEPAIELMARRFRDAMKEAALAGVSVGEKPYLDIPSFLRRNND